jgi:hypothetical protein
MTDTPVAAKAQLELVLDDAINIGADAEAETEVPAPAKNRKRDKKKRTTAAKPAASPPASAPAPIPAAVAVPVPVPAPEKEIRRVPVVFTAYYSDGDEQHGTVPDVFAPSTTEREVLTYVLGLLDSIALNKIVSLTIEVPRHALVPEPAPCFAWLSCGSVRTFHF